MKSSSAKFLFYVFLLTALCAAAQWAWNCHAPEKMRLYDGPWLLAIFSTSVIAVHLALVSSTKGSGNAFIRAFMASMAIKFFLYISVLMLFLLYSNDNKQTLVLHFLFYYFSFNALEITMLYKEAKK